MQVVQHRSPCFPLCHIPSYHKLRSSPLQVVFNYREKPQGADLLQSWKSFSPPFLHPSLSSFLPASFHSFIHSFPHSFYIRCHCRCLGNIVNRAGKLSLKHVQRRRSKRCPMKIEGKNYGGFAWRSKVLGKFYVCSQTPVGLLCKRESKFHLKVSRSQRLKLRESHLSSGSGESV